MQIKDREKINTSKLYKRLADKSTPNNLTLNASNDGKKNDQLECKLC